MIVTFTTAFRPDETQRISAVRRYDILDTPPDGAFDRITAIAARRFKVPIAIISIVDEDRIWFKSHHGTESDQIDRDPGLCASAIMEDGPYILCDALVDPRSLSNPLVAGEFGLRFYAAVPLKTYDGHSLGTLCVIDKEPRVVTEEQIEDLKDLASVVMDQMELRFQARRALSAAELMAKEIDHRVMNSLQFISALLAMQGRMIQTPEAGHHLQSAAARVSAIARVHRHAFTDGATQIACLPFLRGFCDSLSVIVDRPVSLSADEGTLPSGAAQSLGLIVNELVTNAAKYGAENIDVSYRIEGVFHEIEVSDDGPGLPADFEPVGTRQTLGMRVVATLVAQLGGAFTVGPGAKGRGASFSVRFAATE